ncbi:MAG: hypothetical protein H7A55_14075 [Verrucomicrobiaceae bacterium]|nr:hypothetical protein [Verrucomicrobiaceae bacterium]
MASFDRLKPWATMLGQARPLPVALSFSSSSVAAEWRGVTKDLRESARLVCGAAPAWQGVSG